MLGTLSLLGWKGLFERKDSHTLTSPLWSRDQDTGWKHCVTRLCAAFYTLISVTPEVAANAPKSGLLPFFFPSEQQID